MQMDRDRVNQIFIRFHQQSRSSICVSKLVATNKATKTLDGIYVLVEVERHFHETD
jgi:hypothetical protein